MGELSDTQKKCTYCSKYIRKEMTVCEYCGYNFQTGALDPHFKPGSPSDARAKGKIAKRLKVFFAAVLFIATFVVLYNGIGGKSDFLNSLASNIMERLQNLNWKKETKASVHTSGKKNKPLVTFSQVTLLDKTAIEKRKKFLVLEGIVYTYGGKSFITINGEVLTEGDTIASVEVGKIRENSVELLLPNGESKTLEISQSIPIPTIK